ncbi:recombinase family protein, partial [Streptomyces scopuliridis]
MVDLYIRKSKRRDGEYSTGAQESELRAWATRAGLEVRKVFVDNGKSGYKRGVKRDGFDDALAAVTAGVVATLAVFKLDRLSRQGMGQVGLVLDSVAEAGGRIVSVRDGLDSSVSGQRIVFA